MKYGEPISLFNGKDLSGWKVMNPNAPNGWSVKDGLLVNDAKQEPGRHISYSNLRLRRSSKISISRSKCACPREGTVASICGVFTKSRLVTPLDEGSTHTTWAVSTVESHQPLPSKSRAGQWQTMDITLVNRHVTVVLNGKKIIDNQPLLGCTGGALWSDEFRPGPIYLQGDHTSVDYRNIVLRPVVNN